MWIGKTWVKTRMLLRVWQRMANQSSKSDFRRRFGRFQSAISFLRDPYPLQLHFMGPLSLLGLVPACSWKVGLTRKLKRMEASSGSLINEHWTAKRSVISFHLYEGCFKCSERLSISDLVLNSL